MLGIVCRDMIMINITGIDCKVGDEVVLFDKDHPGRDMAEKAGTISYELLTGIQNMLLKSMPYARAQATSHNTATVSQVMRVWSSWVNIRNTNL